MCDNMCEDTVCPFCGAPMKIDVSHSCQDKPEDEAMHMMADKVGLQSAIAHRDFQKQMEQMMKKHK